MRKGLVMTGIAAVMFGAAALHIISDKQGTITQPIRKPEVLPPGNTLRFDLPYPITSLCPSDPLSGNWFLFPLLYSYLFVPGEPGTELQPDLAVQWNYDPDSFTWTIVLRDDAFRHDGERVTAEDVRYSLSAPFLSMDVSDHLLPLIERVDVLSDTRVSLVLTRDDPEFVHKLEFVWIVPDPSRCPMECWERPVGTGPYRFAFRNGEREVGLVANEKHYHGRPLMDEIIFQYQPDSRNSWERLLTEQADISVHLQPQEFNRIKPYEDKFHSSSEVHAQYTILLYNTDDPLFHDLRVRLALSCAIDKELIVTRCLNGFGVVARGPFGPESPYHDPGADPVSYDVAKAQRLLLEAGWSREEKDGILHKGENPFAFTLLVWDEGVDHRKVAGYLKDRLLSLGIHVRIQSVSLGELLSKVWSTHDFQAALTDFISTDGGEMLRSLWCPTMPDKKSGTGACRDAVLSDLFDKACGERDERKRTELLRAIDAEITAFQPGTFLYHRAYLSVMSKRIDYPFPFGLSEIGIYRLRHASIKAPAPESPSSPSSETRQ